MMRYFLRDQIWLLTELARRMRDTDDSRWSKEEKYVAINGAIRRWAPRVKVPFLYTLTSGWSSNSYTVSLPDWMDPRYIRPQIESDAVSGISLIDTGVTTYVDIKGFVIEPSSTGTVLRLTVVPYEAEGRIIYWMAPGPVPSPDVATVSSDDTTSITITSTDDDMGDCGFIKVNNEWIQYSGLTRGSGTVTLSNLVRGVNQTTQAAHSASDSVLWGVPVDRLDLYDNMMNQAAAQLHAMYLSDGSATEKEQHQWNMRYFQQAADEFWPTYVSSFEPMLMIDNPLKGMAYEE